MYEFVSIREKLKYQSTVLYISPSIFHRP